MGSQGALQNTCVVRIQIFEWKPDDLAFSLIFEERSVETGSMIQNALVSYVYIPVAERVVSESAGNV